MFSDYDIYQTKYDGNCMLAAIAHQLHMTGVETQLLSTQCLRQRLAEHLYFDKDLANLVEKGLAGLLGRSVLFFKKTKHHHSNVQYVLMYRPPP